MSNRGTLTYPEITSQPAALQAALEQVRQRGDWARRYFGEGAYDQVVFVGSGSSYYQAQTMAATYRKWLGRPAVALPSSDLFLCREQAVAQLARNLVVGVSRSGESSEVILALDAVKDLPGWDVCGVTCHEESALGRLCDCLVSPLGKEQSTVMTRSLSSMTFMVQAAIASVAGERSAALLAELEQVLAMDAGVVERSDRAARALAEEQAYVNTVYLGLGALNGIAQEACLKLKEMANVWTESYGTLEFRHGPKSIITGGSLVCLLVSEGSRAYELRVAEEMKGYGARVVLLTAAAGADTAFADLVVELGGRELSDEARAALYLPFVQYFGFHTAMNKGVDPDHPRNLTQVVRI